MKKKYSLIRKLSSKDINRIDEVLKEIVDGKLINLVPYIIRRMKNTSNPIIRNEMAIALRDLKANQAVDTLIELACNPKNKDFTGTLVYALQGLDCKDKFLYLVDVFIEGSYETSEMALQIIKKYIKKIPLPTRQIALKLLRYGKLQIEDDEKNLAIDSLISELR